MIAVIIPTLNEEEGIERVVEAIPETIYDHDVEIFVLDGGSEDATRNIAERAGATVVNQYYPGAKGSAVRQAFNDIEAEYYVMLDGDGSYLPKEMESVVEPVVTGEADHVIGTRLANREKGALPRLNLLGNLLFNRLVSWFFDRDVTDMLSGYRAFSSEMVDNMELLSDAFGIETEMTVLTIDSDARLVEVPVTYRERQGHSKLHPFTDGARILRTIASLVKDLKPFRLYGALASIAMLAGLILLLSIPVAGEGFVTRSLITIFGVGSVFTSFFLIIVAVIAGQQRNNYKRLRSAAADGVWS
jgi:dolichol-phosphate mannosyltransferase